MFKVYREYDDAYMEDAVGVPSVYKTLPRACERAQDVSLYARGSAVVVSLSENYRILARFSEGVRVEFSADIPT